MAEIIALALIGAGWYGKRMMSLMQTDTEFNKADMTNPYISMEKEQAMRGYWTVALFGVDSRDSSVGKGNMSDVIITVSYTHLKCKERRYKRRRYKGR